MTIYDALSQEYGLLIYHDYLLDNNQELLAEMCLSPFIESNHIHLRCWTGARFSASTISRTGAEAIERTRSASGSILCPETRSWSGSATRCG